MRLGFVNTKSAWLWGSCGLLVMGGLVIVGAILFPLGSGPTSAKNAIPASQQTSQTGPRVPTVKVVRQDLKRTVEMVATVESYETADLYAKIGGYLETLAVDIGDPIAKGQALAQLSIPEMDKELVQKEALVKQAEATAEQALKAIDQAKAEMDSAHALWKLAETQRSEKEALVELKQSTHDRIKYLVDQQSTLAMQLDEVRYDLKLAKAARNTHEAKIRSAEEEWKAAGAKWEKAKADYQSALAQVDVAKANVEYLKARMDYATIPAPFNGVVTRRLVDPGAFIQPAEGNSAAKPLLTVARTDAVRIVGFLPIYEVRWLDKRTATAEVHLEGLPGETFQAKVARFSPSLHEKARMMRVELGLAKPDPRFLPGSYVKAKLHLVDYPNALVIPAAALLTDAKGKFVYVVENGECQRRPVTTLYEDGAKIGIASGLKGGAEIVSAGGGQLAAGQKVMPVLALNQKPSQ